MAPRRVAPRTAHRQRDLRQARGAVLVGAVSLILLAANIWISAAARHPVAARTPAADTTPATSASSAQPKPAAATPRPAPAPAATGQVLAAEAAPEPDGARQARLQALVDSFAAGQSAKFGLVVMDLKTGLSATYQPDAKMLSASLYKLFVADTIYRMIDARSLSYSATAGDTGRTVDNCLRLMITISDNSCGQALGGMTGWQQQNTQLRAEGFTDTDMTIEPQTSASDTALLLKKLYHDQLNSHDANQRLLELLKNNYWRDRLPAGLPSGTVIADKTGNLYDYVHDVGIVYGPKTDYVVAALSGPWPAPALAPVSFADLSRQLWNFFEQ